MSLETTVGGQEFYEQGLAHYVPKDPDTIGLPGLGRVATKQLREFGIQDAKTLFGSYVSFGCNDEVFIEYLETVVGVKFRGNAYGGTAENMKLILCKTLRAKWDKIKEY